MTCSPEVRAVAWYAEVILTGAAPVWLYLLSAARIVKLTPHGGKRLPIRRLGQHLVRDGQILDLSRKIGDKPLASRT